MKKILFVIAAVVAMCVATSCGNKAADATLEAGVDSLAVDSVEVVDTLVVDTVAVDSVAEVVAE